MQNSIGKIKRFLKPISYTKGWWWGLFFTDIFDGFQSIFTIQIGAYIVAAIERKDIYSIKFWCIMLAIIFIFSYVMRRVSEMTMEMSKGLCEIEFRKEYFKQYLNLDNTKTEKIGTGKMQNIIFEGIRNRIAILLFVFPETIVSIGSTIYAFILIANKVPNQKYFVGFLLLFIIAAGLMRVGLGLMRKTRKKGKEISLEIARRDIKIIMSKFEILQNNKLGEEIEKQAVSVKKFIKIRQNGNTIKLLRQTSSSMIIDGIQLSIYVVVGIGIITGNYTFAYLMLLLQLLNTISKYLWVIRKQLKEYYLGITHVEKLRETFESIPQMKISKNEKNFIYKTGDIEIKNISFAYDALPIFKDLNLVLQGGTKTAFVGESGGGKTTLIKLLAGYIKADNGEIIIDGQKISKIKLTDYYKHIGYLSQEPSVFDGTIHENLVYALDKEPDKKDLEKAVNDAKCEFIREFADGLETEIGERGVRLSGGQKQRLAIAKIMLKNPNIIFLDEPTSALDSFNEELINIALHNLFKGKTVIVVAHRLQTVKTANRILLIEQGRILEEGTHAQLVKKNGKYKKMLDLQSGF
ncbi:MAG: ABC transporter ATP-binding protein [candidate division SR1 bacterium]|nr:ABC transporter ATP-binding protein [candidate division SR1 bacterium]